MENKWKFKLETNVLYVLHWFQLMCILNGKLVCGKTEMERKTKNILCEVSLVVSRSELGKKSFVNGFEFSMLLTNVL